MNYDHNKTFGLFKFQSGYRKLYLNSQNGYSRKKNAQTAKCQNKMYNQNNVLIDHQQARLSRLVDLIMCVCVHQ